MSRSSEAGRGPAGDLPPPVTAAAPDSWFDVAAVSDVGTTRDHNEDSCGAFSNGEGTAVAVVADGVSSSPAGADASQQAVETTLRSFVEQGPRVAPGKRLIRAVQQANIDIYDRAVVVPELRGMSTTLTAVALTGGELCAAHIGDSRLYLVRDGAITQLTKDHTVVAEKVRLGLMSERRAREHPDRSTVTRALGRELIAPVDRLTTRIWRGDVLILCSDGLYNALEPDEMREMVEGLRSALACRVLVDVANARGTRDNLTAAVVRVGPSAPLRPETIGVAARLRRFLTGRRP